MWLRTDIWQRLRLDVVSDPRPGTAESDHLWYTALISDLPQTIFSAVNSIGSTKTNDLRWRNIISLCRVGQQNCEDLNLRDSKNVF